MSDSNRDSPRRSTRADSGSSSPPIPDATLSLPGSPAAAAAGTLGPTSGFIGQYRDPRQARRGRHGRGLRGRAAEPAPPGRAQGHPRRSLRRRRPASRMFQREAETLARLKHPEHRRHLRVRPHRRRPALLRHGAGARVETLDAYLAKRGPRPLGPDELRLRLALFRTIATRSTTRTSAGSSTATSSRPTSSSTDERRPARAPAPRAARCPTVKILDFGLARITEADVRRAWSPRSG